MSTQKNTVESLSQHASARSTQTMNWIARNKGEIK